MDKLSKDRLVEAVDQQVSHLEELKQLIRRPQRTEVIQQQRQTWVQMTDQNR